MPIGDAASRAGHTGAPVSSVPDALALVQTRQLMGGGWPQNANTPIEAVRSSEPRTSTTRTVENGGGYPVSIAHEYLSHSSPRNDLYIALCWNFSFPAVLAPSAVLLFGGGGFRIHDGSSGLCIYWKGGHRLLGGISLVQRTAGSSFDVNQDGTGHSRPDLLVGCRR